MVRSFKNNSKKHFFHYHYIVGIIASEKATFHANFKQLAVSAEGCSTVHFERIIGAEAADKMIKQGSKIDAEEALRIGIRLLYLVQYPVSIGF